MDLATAASRLDERLRTDDFADIDASANGLQVGPSTGSVEHAAFAVDAALETIERAGAAGADLLVTHHGLFWDGLERATGRDYDRLAALIEADLALYVSHLPLDAHPEFGNAAGLADLLGVEARSLFGTYGPEHVGLRGTLAEPTTTGDLREWLSAELDHGEGRLRVLPFGPDRIETVAVLTGSGADWLDEAAAAGVDAFVTGEGKQQVYHAAREAGLTVVLAGHYATEIFGVRSLQSLLGDWGIETTFVDVPTGL